MVAPTRNGEDTMFRVGTIGSKDIDWGDVFTICDLKMVALATTAADPGQGLRRRPEARGGQEARTATASTGSTRRRSRPGRSRSGSATPSTPSATCASPPTARPGRPRRAAGQAPTKYNAVRRFADVTGAPRRPRRSSRSSACRAGTTSPSSGAEDGAPADTVYAVAETTAGTKFLLGFRGTTRDRRRSRSSRRRCGSSSTRRRTRCS